MKLNKKICAGIILLIGIGVFSLFAGGYLYYGIGGRVIVENPDFTIKEYADCNYGMDQLLEERVRCKRITDGIRFKSHAIDKDFYIYKFYIEGKGIEICPEIWLAHSFFKHDRYSFNIDLSPNGEGGYSAVVSESGRIYYSCDDVEKEGIRVTIGP